MVAKLESEDAELLFISGEIFERDFPKDKQYLKKYFRTKVQEDLIKYYFVVHSQTHFTMHSGHRISERWQFTLLAKLRTLEAARAKARSEMDLDLLTIIETGLYRVADGGQLWTKKKH